MGGETEGEKHIREVLSSERPPRSFQKEKKKKKRGEGGGEE